MTKYFKVCFSILGLFVCTNGYVSASEEDLYEKKERAMDLLYNGKKVTEQSIEQASNLFVEAAFLEMKEESNIGESLIYIRRHIGKNVKLIRDEKNKGALVEKLNESLQKEFGLISVK